VRATLERMKPAVLRMKPPEDENGVALLKNENDNRLYYFLQIGDEDAAPEKSDSTPYAAPEGETDCNFKVSFSNPGIEQLYRRWFILTCCLSLQLKLSSEYTSFTFAKEPTDAAELLQEHNDGHSTTALQMVMSEAAGAGVESPTQNAREQKIVEANKEIEKEAPAKDSGSQVDVSTTVYKTVGEKESRTTEKSVSRAMDPKILDDVDVKPTLSNETVDPQVPVCGCCVVM
jgi:hypothetical protein